MRPSIDAKPEYDSYRSMIYRCLNPKHEAYHRYGGRGIQVCQRWLDSFQLFFDDVGRRPSLDHSLERTNNNGNYEPGNVVWATEKEQHRNKRTNHILTVEGVTMCIAEWSERTGLKHSTIRMRLECGWSPERAVSQTTESQIVGQKNPNAKITVGLAEEIRTHYGQTRSQRATAKHFNISQRTVWSVVNGLRWLPDHAKNHALQGSLL